MTNEPKIVIAVTPEQYALLLKAVQRLESSLKPFGALVTQPVAELRGNLESSLARPPSK